MKQLCVGLFLLLSIVTFPLSVNASAPLRDITPNWYPYFHGQQWKDNTLEPPVRTAPLMTGFHSMSMFANIDYKQDMEQFVNITTQYPTSGHIEWFHEVSDFIPVHYDTGKLGHQRAPHYPVGVSAYNYPHTPTPSLFDISLGQWMIQNDVLTRPNASIALNERNMEITPLSTVPFGVQNSHNLMERDEFVITLAKAAFGPIESRPVLFEISSWRYARAVIWWRVYTWVCPPEAPPYWRFDWWELREEKDPDQKLPDLAHARPDSHQILSEPRNQYNEFTHQNVSDCPAGSWGEDGGRNGGGLWNYPSGTAAGAPACGQQYIRRVEFRQEFISNPEGFTNPIMHVHPNDYWVYVSANVWELYLYELLSQGILDHNEVFMDSTLIPKSARPSFVTHGLTTDNFRLENNSGFATEFEKTIDLWGRSKDGVFEFPVMAPELGLVMPGNPYNSTSVNVQVVGIGGQGLPGLADVLGRNYTVGVNSVEWNTSKTKQHRADMGLPLENIFVNENLSVIAALRLIERVLRVTDHNMSQLEASIISHRYGAKFLDTLHPDDVLTLQYLIAMGIIDFENFEEYSSIYSMLSREFAFVLLGRLANPASRTHFSKLLMTDAAGFDTLGNRNYQTYIQYSSNDISRFISEHGEFQHNPTIQEPKWYIGADNNRHLLVERVGEFNFGSDIRLVAVKRPTGTGINQDGSKANASEAYRVILNIDDPLKYTYKDNPLVLTSFNHRLSPYKGLEYPTETQPLYIVTDNDSMRDWRSYDEEFFGMEGAINLRPFPENRVRGDHQEWRDILDDLIKINEARPGAGWMTGRNMLREGNTIVGGIADQWFEPVPNLDSVSEGILGVALLPTGRYIVEFIIPAPSAQTAYDFVLAQMYNLVGNAMINTEEVPGAATLSGERLVAENTSMTANLSVHNDIVTRGDLTGTIGQDVAVIGNHVVSGEFDYNEHGVSYIPLSYASSAGNTIKNQTDQQTLMLIDHPQLNANNNTVTSLGGTQEIRTGTFYNSQFINITLSGLQEMITSEFVFKHKVRIHTSEGTLEPEIVEVGTITGQVIVDFLPYVPTRAEQAGYLNNQYDASAEDWFFTQPTDVNLREFWDFNLEITKAILKTLSIPESVITSGYYIPHVRILIPELKSNKSLVDDFLQQFLEVVGRNINPSWIGMWVSPPNNFDKPSSSTVYTSAARGVLYQGHRTDIPFWAELYFFQNPEQRPVPASLLEARIHLPEISSHLIHEYYGQHMAFGMETDFVQDIGDDSLSFAPMFLLTEFGHVFMNSLLTDLAFHGGKFYDVTGTSHNFSGTKVTLNNRPAVIVNHTANEFWIVMEDDIQGRIDSAGRPMVDLPGVDGYRSGQNNKTVMQFGQDMISAILSNLSGNSSNVTRTYNFNPFNTQNHLLQYENGTQVVIRNGAVSTVTAMSMENGPSKMVNASVFAELPFLYKPYVRLDTTQWIVNASNQVVWSPSLNTTITDSIGARITQRTVDSILSLESLNVLNTVDLRNTSIHMGGDVYLMIDGNGDKVLRVPFFSGFFFSDKTINIAAVHQYIDQQGDTTENTSNGQWYKATNFIGVAGLAPWVQNSHTYNHSNGVLVQVDGVPTIVTPDGIAVWTGSKPAYVDFALERHVDFIVTVTNVSGSMASARPYSQQTATPVRWGQPSANMGIDNLGKSFYRTFGTHVIAYEGVSNALEFFQQLKDNYVYMRTRGFLSSIVFWAITLSMGFACLILVFRVMHEVNFSRNIVEGWYNSTSIDIFALGSLGIIRVDDEPRNWIQVIFIVLAIGILPITIVSIFHVFGFVII